MANERINHPPDRVVAKDVPRLKMNPYTRLAFVLGLFGSSALSAMACKIGNPSSSVEAETTNYNTSTTTVSRFEAKERVLSIIDASSTLILGNKGKSTPHNLIASLSAYVSGHYGSGSIIYDPDTGKVILEVTTNAKGEKAKITLIEEWDLTVKK